MARLESNAKMGFYPTPETTLRASEGMDLVRRRHPPSRSVLRRREGPRRRSQGKAGPTGSSLTRSGAWRQGEALTCFAEGSIFNARINPLGSMGLLFLNPPYDTEDGERVEMKFLKHAHKWLADGGLLVFIVPGHVLSGERCRKWIGHRYEDIRIVRVARQDYPRFSQVVLFAQKRPEGFPEPLPRAVAYIDQEEPTRLHRTGNGRTRDIPGGRHRHRRGDKGQLAEAHAHPPGNQQGCRRNGPAQPDPSLEEGAHGVASHFRRPGRRHRDERRRPHRQGLLRPGRDVDRGRGGGMRDSPEHVLRGHQGNRRRAMV